MSLEFLFPNSETSRVALDRSLLRASGSPSERKGRNFPVSFTSVYSFHLSFMKN